MVFELILPSSLSYTTLKRIGDGGDGDDEAEGEEEDDNENDDGADEDSVDEGGNNNEFIIPQVLIYSADIMINYYL